MDIIHISGHIPEGMIDDHDAGRSWTDFCKNRSMDNYIILDPAPRSPNNKITGPRTTFYAAAFQATLAKRVGRRRTTQPIMYSNSTGMIKPPPIEKKLECTLEELCHGCIKKVKITRDLIKKSGQIVCEEEWVTIRVQPGWRTGTKVTFEGMGTEIEGTQPADITFLIAEKKHPLFIREGDYDLELAVEVPLVEALTGFTIDIPLLGGESMSLMIDEVIHHGYKMIIAGQGMPTSNEEGKRGDLRILFLVDFPTQLTHDQQLDILAILQDCC